MLGGHGAAGAEDGVASVAVEHAVGGETSGGDITLGRPERRRAAIGRRRAAGAGQRRQGDGEAAMLGGTSDLV